MAYVLFATKNVPLDPSYKDVIRFEPSTSPVPSVSETAEDVRDEFMATYFRNYADTSSIYKSYANYNEVNFDYGDGINTVLTYDLSKLLATPQSQYDKVMNLALNSNYLHFRPTASAGTNTDRFYFIRSARELSANVVQFVLELDLFTTYPEMYIRGGAFVTRAHMDRFSDKGGGRYWFNQNATIGDVIDNNFDATIPGTKNVFEVQYTETGEEFAAVNTALNKTEWAYFWFAEQPWDAAYAWQSRLRILSAADIPASFNDVTNRSKEPPTLPVLINDGTFAADKGFNYGLYCAVVPVRTILVYDGATLEKGWGVGQFYEWAFGQQELVGITISPYAPFITHANGGKIWENFFIDGSGRLSFQQNTRDATLTSGSITGYKWLDTPEGFLMYHNNITPTQYIWMQRIILREQFLNTSQFVNLTTDLTTNAAASFTTKPAYNKTRDKGFEPKLFTAPYRRLALQSFYSQSIDFSPLAFDGRRVRPRIQSVPNPVQEKLVYSLVGDDTNWVSTSFYNKYFINNLAGKQINQYTMPVGEDAWKNFWSNRGAQTLAGLGLTAAGAIAGGPLGIAAAVGSAINTGASILQANISPNTARANGNDLPAEYAQTSDLKTFVMEKTLLPEDENRAWDYFFNYGYQPNKVMLLNDSANGFLRRTRFNYVKAEDTTLVDRFFDNASSPLVPRTMSKPIRQRLQEAFNGGITFWTYYGSSTNATKQTAITFINQNIFDRTAYENLEKIFAYT